MSKIYDLTSQRFVSEASLPEKVLQQHIEKNLPRLLGLHLVDSEFILQDDNGNIYRLDSVGVTGDGRPVVIEYKQDHSRTVIRQAVTYMDVLLHRRQKFNTIVAQKISSKMAMDWRKPKIICIAKTFDRSDIILARYLKLDIELWQYIYYDNCALQLKQVFPANEDGSLYRDTVHTALLTDPTDFDKTLTSVHELLNTMAEFLHQHYYIDEVADVCKRGKNALSMLCIPAIQPTLGGMEKPTKDQLAYMVVPSC